MNPLTFNPRVPKLQTDQRKHRNYQHLKPAYQAMNWKNYAINRPRNISLQNADRLSAKNSIRQHHSPSYYGQQHYQVHNVSHLSAKKVREQNLRLSGVTYNSKREQHAQRVKQDAVRRVKMLQQKVLPLITSDKHKNEDQNEQYGFAWQMKMQQKLVKIQTSIQKVKNEMEIKYEKRLIQIERQWQERINELLEMVGVENVVRNRQQQLRQAENGQIQRHGQQQDVVMSNGHRYEQRYETQQQHGYNRNNNQYNYYRSGFSVQQQLENRNNEQMN